MQKVSMAFVAACGFFVCLPQAVVAYTVGDLTWGAEIKGHVRHSSANAFATEFPFPPEALPVGADSAFLQTVDEGTHAEISQISLFGRWRMAPDWSLQFAFDGIDKYERNPTSTDYKYGVDTLLLRYGESLAALETTQLLRGYVQVGKFPKFERQRERRTESYGLVANAFNRFEDSGIEAGVFLPSGFYGKLSWTTGNPVFIRDPNALAGDNGTEDFRVPPNMNPDPRYKSGVPIFYDAEIEDFDLSRHAELGAGIGYRLEAPDRSRRLDVMLFGYQRELASEQRLHGTFYGADLDLFDLGEVPGAGAIRLPVTDDIKRELGVNVWFESGTFALFGQVVDQDLAGLGRWGYELELSYALPGRVNVVPVVRLSRLQHDFQGSAAYPAPSVWWDWRKVDAGVNFILSDALSLILEYSANRFEHDDGSHDSNNEALLTVRWRLQ